jgi:hypothetical protein
VILHNADSVYGAVTVIEPTPVPYSQKSLLELARDSPVLKLDSRDTAAVCELARSKPKFVCDCVTELPVAVKYCEDADVTPTAESESCICPLLRNLQVMWTRHFQQ